ncbi:tRNA ligase subunit PheS family protein [Candidatus Vidania fulgoroideorum]
MCGAGNVHKRIIKGKEGFAFGMGIERIMMVKYNISDIKRIYEN